MRTLKYSLCIVGAKGLAVLNGLHEDCKKKIDQVIVGMDSGVCDDSYTRILKFCEEEKIGCLLKEDADLFISNYDGYLIAIGWRWLLPNSGRIVVLHDSLLPKYRGFSPLANCLINGESVIGATALFATERYDEGPIIAQRSTNINYPIKINSAINIIGNMYSEIVNDLILKLSNDGHINSVEQNNNEATYSLWRDEIDYRIDWGQSARDILRFIDAVGYPYDSAESVTEYGVVKIKSAVLTDDVVIRDRQSAIGKVIFIEDGNPVVVCGVGLLKIIEMTCPNGKSLIPIKKFRIRFN